MKRNFIVAAVAFAILPTVGCDSLRAHMLAQDGVELYKKAQVAESVAKFQEAEKADDKIPTIELNLGFAALSLYQAQPTTAIGIKASQTAVHAFEKYLTLKPNEERAKTFLIQTFIDTGRYEEAVTYFKPAIENSATPRDQVSEMLGTIGAIASKTGRYEDAKGWFEKRIAVDPTNADARVAVGVLMWDHLKTHPEIIGDDRTKMADEAIAVLGEAIKIAPNAPNAYTYTNLVYRERALAALDDDHKRPDLEAANKFFLQAVELQKGGKK